MYRLHPKSEEYGKFFIYKNTFFYTSTQKVTTSAQSYAIRSPLPRPFPSIPPARRSSSSLLFALISPTGRHPLLKFEHNAP